MNSTSQSPTAPPKSPARVAAGKRNRQLRGILTDVGRQQLRHAAFRDQPWRFSTGPHTPAGKAAAAMNGRKYKKGIYSVSERRAMAAGVNGLIARMAKQRALVAEQNFGGATCS